MIPEQGEPAKQSLAGRPPEGVQVVVIYLVTLAAASGLTGIAVQRVLAGQGYAPTFEMQTALALTVAAAFAAFEFSYTALMRVLAPTKHGSLYLAEAASHAAAALLLPPLLGYELPRPEFLALGEALWQQAQPLLYLAGFLALHAALKVVVFFTALQAPAASRWGALTWLILASAAAYGSWRASEEWTGALRANRPEASAEAAAVEVNGVRAQARTLPEGSAMTFDGGSASGRTLTFWVGPPSDPGQRAPETAHFAIEFAGAAGRSYRTSVDVNEAGWGRVFLDSAAVPDDAGRCVVTWTSEPPPPWNRWTDLRPVTASGKAIALSGPHLAEPQDDERPPNVILIAIDALSTDALTAFGAPEGATPSLDRFTAQAVTFPNGTAPSSESAASFVSLVTGESPLAHGVLGSSLGPAPLEIPSLAQILGGMGYLTSAFLETGDQANGALTAVLGRGFDYVDARAGAEESEQTPSAATLERMLDWVEEHQDACFMAAARLTELSDLEPRPAYELEGNGNEDALYRAAVSHLDLQLGAFIKQVRDSVIGHRVCLVIAATRGRQPGDRVPLFILEPMRPSEQRDLPVAAADLFPTLCAATGALPGRDFGNRIMFRSSYDRQPVSVAAQPFVLSTRTREWRVQWTPGGDPFAYAGGTEGPARLYRLMDEQPRDRSGEHPEFTRQWVAWLADWAANELERRERLTRGRTR